MTKELKVYEDAWTLDGRLKPTRGTITKTKVKAVKELLTAHLAGNGVATATLTEALTSTDAIFNLSYLTNLNFVPNYEAEDQEWRSIAGERTVPDFRPVTLYTINRNWTDGNGESNVLGAHGEAPVIPEGTGYPYAYIAGEVAQGTGVRKRGLKTDWTLESRINDGLAALDNLPSELLEVSKDTDSADVWGALTTQVTAASALDGGEVPGGLAAVPPNAPISADAIARAIIELSERTINGRKIRVTGGYNLIVPVGQGLFANFIINSQALAGIDTTSGAITQRVTVNGYNPLAAVSVVESEWITGESWYLLPKPGATRRPVLEHLSLRGYEAPQIFVDNHTGNFVGAGAVSPFEGNFAADVITLKLRQFGGGILWDSGAAVVTSNGTGVA